jgi:hypothetical protein
MDNEGAQSIAIVAICNEVTLTQGHAAFVPFGEEELAGGAQ